MIGERLTGRTVDGGSLWVVIKEGLRRQDFRLHAVRKWRELCAWISQSSEEEKSGLFFATMGQLFLLLWLS